MEKYAATALILTALAFFVAFWMTRHDVQVMGTAVLIHDRWGGRVALCAFDRTERPVQCRAYFDLSELDSQPAGQVIVRVPDASSAETPSAESRLRRALGLPD